MQSASYSRVDLEKGSSGFGLKLDGGKDHGRDLSIVSLAPDSPALHSGRIQVGHREGIGALQVNLSNGPGAWECNHL